MFFVNARVPTPAGVVFPCCVEVRDGRVTTVRELPGGEIPDGELPDADVALAPSGNDVPEDAGTGNHFPPGADTVDLRGQWLLPGFVDQHVHGGGGASCTDGDQQETLRMVDFHRRHGTTTMLASLITAPLDDLLRSVASLAELADDGHIAGIHLEGPFLSAVQCGAQNPAYLRQPDRTTVQQLLDAGRGHLRMVTVAPEIPGGLDAIAQLTDAGVVVAAGHSNASYEEAAAGFAAGATVATHLFNGMRPMLHRDPGIAGAALDSEPVVCEVIADGIHVHEAALRLVVHSAGPRRVAVITDAMSAAGSDEGHYRLGELSVTVRNGAALLDGGDGALAGSTLDMGTALQRLVSFGIGVPEAAEMLSTTPARVLGLDRLSGTVASGRPADLVVAGEAGSISGVMRRGEWIAPLA